MGRDAVGSAVSIAPPILRGGCRSGGQAVTRHRIKAEFKVFGHAAGTPPPPTFSTFPTPFGELRFPCWFACEERSPSYQPPQDLSGPLGTICFLTLQALYPARAVFLSVILPIPPQESRPAAASDPELSAWSSELGQAFSLTLSSSLDPFDTTNAG